MIDFIKYLPELPGIYKITSPTGRIYIGEAKNLKIRCSYSKEAATFFGCSSSSIRENKKNNWKLKGRYIIKDIT
jgi:hypothetical protein